MSETAPPPPQSELPESHEALELLRPKQVPASRLVRASILEARRAASPYTTTTRVALSQMVRNRLARSGALVLASLALVAIFADFLASNLPVACHWHGRLYLLPNVTHPAALAETDCDRMRADRVPGDWFVLPLATHGPNESSGGSAALLPPLSPGHALGTDARGRDVFARVVHGARTALGVGLGGSFVLVVIGLTLGAFAGFAGGIADAVVARLIESLTAIPTLLLVLVVGALVPHATTGTLVWTIALTRWTELARLVRADVLVTLGKDYVTAARALGASPGRVLRRHVLPHALGPAIVAAAFGVASIVLVEAAVDFLRIDSPDTMASWGETLGEARSSAGAWWLIAFPGAALLATLTALNLVGEAARDAMDPYLDVDAH
jgi:peptide/nickel transport system permease protein